MNLRGKKYIQTQEGLNAYADAIRDMNLPEYGVVIEIKFGVRTTKQNSAMHKYFTMLAETLNDAGLDQRKLLKPSFMLPWSTSSVKKHLWGGLMKALTGKEHTSDLERNEVSEIYDVLSRNLAEKHGILVPFPSKEQM